jgi:uncharacterized membrane protein
VPAGAAPICAEKTGYITHIDVKRLERLADREGLIVHIASLPGAFVYPERPLARIEGRLDDDTCEALVDAFSVLPDRDFQQDPRFGLIVLPEIASRALSPAVNDPGTAIRVLGAGHRVLSTLSDTQAGDASRCHHRVHAPDMQIKDLFDDFFRPIARDGAGNIEVQLRLRATLAALADHAPQLFGSQARAQASAALARAEDASLFGDDLTALRLADPRLNS